MDYFVAPVSCGALPVISHTSNNNTGTDYDDTITYTCLSGYENTSGNLVRTCQADKTWSGSPPVCCKYHLACFDMSIKSGCKHVLIPQQHKINLVFVDIL